MHENIKVSIFGIPGTGEGTKRFVATSKFQFVAKYKASITFVLQVKFQALIIIKKGGVTFFRLHGTKLRATIIYSSATMTRPNIRFLDEAMLGHSALLNRNFSREGDIEIWGKLA